MISSGDFLPWSANLNDIVIIKLIIRVFVLVIYLTVNWITRMIFMLFLIRVFLLLKLT